MSTLLADLHARGLLDSAMVIWMGEFGRDPRINNGGAPMGKVRNGREQGFWMRVAHRNGKNPRRVANRGSRTCDLANAGREHYAQAWTTVLGGGGLRVG
jgi:hypothetical protein